MARPEDAELEGAQTAPELEETHGEKPAAPTVRERTINGRKFQVDPELDEAITQRERDAERKISQNSDELGRLRKFYNDNQPKQPTVDNSYDSALFESPTATLRRVQKEAVDQATAIVEERYNQMKSLEKFWDDFYDNNKDLRRGRDHFVAEKLAQDNLRTLLPLSPAEQAERLANMTREKILEWKREGAETVDDNPAVPRSRVETPSRPSPRTPATEDKEPATIGDVLQARAKARRSAA